MEIQASVVPGEAYTDHEMELMPVPLPGVFCIVKVPLTAPPAAVLPVGCETAVTI